MSMPDILGFRGMTRGLDELGRVVIPKEYRRMLNLSKHDTLEVRVEGETILINKYRPNYEKNDLIVKLNELNATLTNPAARATIKQALEYIK